MVSMVSMDSEAATRAESGAPRERSWAAFVATIVVAACSGAGCNGRSLDAALARNAECSVRVIMRFAGAPDSARLADLERTNAIELEPLDTITNDLRVYMLHAAGSDECAAAIDRLRRDEGVRSIDVDARRELHEEP